MNKYSSKIRYVGGCKQSPPDNRDFRIKSWFKRKPMPFSSASGVVSELVISKQNLTLYQHSTPVTNQGLMQSCVGHATIAVLELLRNKQGKDRINLSEAFVWHKARLAQGWLGQNTGTYIRDALKSLLHDGVVEEHLFPTTNDYKVSPPWLANLAAKWTRIKAFYACNGINDVKLAIDNGMPVVIGAIVGNKFREYNGEPSILRREEPVGASYGHALALLAYDDSRNAFLLKNSWGSQYGLNGYLWASYDWFDEQVFESWSVNA